MAYTAAPLCILTQNCRGLNMPEKHLHLLQELKSKQVTIALLQETHLKPTDTHRLKDRHYPTNCHSTHPTAQKTGVAILIAANTQFTQTDQLADLRARYLGKPFTTIYDIHHICFYARRFAKAIRKTLRDLRLVDAWRSLHPTDRDYTHYSAIHRRYSCIDYILIQQEGLQRLQSAEILPTPWSDQSAVSIRLDSPLFRPTRTAWRLNESLLSDPEVKTQLTEHLNNYFTENNTEDVSKVTLSEAHKSVLRGHFIRIASHKKRKHSNT
ncbi:Hypothetical predicted protein [Pelobates cultripes]|uniref:exodeoxyribonuclease III n=1 Tax=Pelobates cultripes TaxID=61616 RepID=A0AAD1T7P2_PELCU|nr:Hypothetical predicted protein [Pelobates cultripes]